MLTKEIARWLLGGFSKETVRWIIGGFLFIPIVVVPIILVIALFVGLRKVTPIRKTGILNLITASGVTLLILPSAIFHRQFSWGIWSMEASFAILWLVCAIGLFSRNRIAWCGSLVGTAVSVCVLVAAFGATIPTFLYPGAQDTPHSGPFLVGHVYSIINILAWLCLALTVSLHLLFGLLRLRKVIFGNGTTVPNGLHWTPR
jgi:hypothetical protein